MKKFLFTSTALAAMAFGGVASAQGISLFGDARLGLGYNIYNNGDLNLNSDGETDDDIRAVSRVRFGVNMTGQTDSGITFGATIRADNASNGQGGSLGQRAGNVFVSGDWGTLTFGDTDGADERHVGDLNEIGLTCLTCQNETPFISNGGGFGDDDSNNFASNPEARPTVRYDIDIAGFGLSLSTNRDLNDVGVGLGYDGQFGDTAFSIGLGYYDFNEFDTSVTRGTLVEVVDSNGELVLVPGLPESDVVQVGGGKQWSGAVGVDFDMFNAKVIYTRIDMDAGPEADWAGIGIGTSFGEFGIDAYYAQIVDANSYVDGWNDLASYGVGVTYDLGGGASVKAGLGSMMSLAAEDDGFVVGDFGIRMSF